VSWYQKGFKGKTNLDFTEARDSEWQWHELGHMQVCTSLQTDKHASTPPLSFFTGQMPFLLPNQQCQSTEGRQLKAVGRQTDSKLHVQSLTSPLQTSWVQLPSAMSGLEMERVYSCNHGTKNYNETAQCTQILTKMAD